VREGAVMGSNGDGGAEFDPRDFDSFCFDGIRFDRSSGQARFEYRLTGRSTVAFTETVGFTLPGQAAETDAERLDAALHLLGALLGLSYYKAAAPGRFELRVPLARSAIDYLAAALRSGLAEFAYRNGLPGLLAPEIVPAGGIRDDLASEPLSATALRRPLVPIGGGKDSVVTVEALAKTGLAVTQFAVRPNSIIRRVAAAAGLPFVAAERTIDPFLIELNGRGALNGHVPVTAMNSLIAVVQSLLLGLGPVVMSNERSASDPTLDWNGVPVNHQWSKSLEAEQLLDRALRGQLGVSGLCFSLLRPFSELRIARAFSRTDGYDDAIVSCNRAYRMGAGTASWCGDCDKCRFIYLAFAPYMPKARLRAILGRDLFADPDQVEGYRQLLGLGRHKPFECVGEEAECVVAFGLASRSEEWRDSEVVRLLLEEAPELQRGDSALEDEVLGVRAGGGPAVEPPSEDYRKARDAVG